MTTILQRSQAMLLKQLPPELLRIVVDICADDPAVGRATLLSLSVMDKYLRDVTRPRLFQRIRFRDSPESRGDEIVHSIRRFMAAPELWCHVRTVSVYLNRLKWLGTDDFIPTQLYHYLVLPELVDALVRMPGATELFVRLNSMQAARCLNDLGGAVHWCSAGRKLNIRSLTVSPDNLEYIYSTGSNPYFENGFLRAFPQLETFCYDGQDMSPTQMTLLPEGCFDPTTATNLKQFRLYKTRSDPRTEFYSYGWKEREFPQLKLYQMTPELEYLSVLGELDGFPVSRLLRQLTKIPKLKYLDITDEQTMVGYRTRQQLIDLALPSHPSDRLPYIKTLASSHTLNENRYELARETFDQCVKLRRICFVRSCLGEVYLRGYPDAVADSMGYVSPDIKGADLIDIPERWHHGVPQTGLLPFPSFTPWEGIENAK